MESNSNQKIAELLEQTINLLAENNQEEWANCLRNLLNNYVNSSDKKDEKEAVIPIMRVMLGGSGSLSDVVLHKERKPLINDNNKLYDLPNQLYDECNKLQ